MTAFNPRALSLMRGFLAFAMILNICTAKALIGQDLLSDPPSLELSIWDNIPQGQMERIEFDLSQKVQLKSSLETRLSGVELKVKDLTIERMLYSKQSELLLVLPSRTTRPIYLTIKEVNILSTDYKLSTSKTSPSIERPRTFQGEVLGDPTSSVQLTLNKNFLRLFISDKRGNYQLTNQQKGSDVYTLFNSRYQKSNIKRDCFTPDIPFAGPLNSEINRKKDNRKSDACIPLYLETDMSTYSYFNNDLVQVQNYMIALVNEVIALYTQENISISLSHLHIATTPEDDFSSSYSFARDVIDAFAEKRKDNFNGRLAHFTTHRNLLGGIGWVDVLCSEYSTYQADWDLDGIPETHHYGPYSVSSAIGEGIEQIPVYSWDVMVMAHEIGHNLGAAHTHACAWGPNNKAIDNCQSLEGVCDLIQSPTPETELGTLMSYCHLTEVGIDFSKGLGTLPGNRIRDRITQANCSLSCSGIVEGCLDPDDHNYNANANVSDGTCIGTCSDAIKNGDETGIDCGGLLCLPCQEVCTSNLIKVRLNLDSYPNETQWMLIDSLTGDTLERQGPYDNSMANDSVIAEFCLPDGDYLFIIQDQFGDGICCGEDQILISDRLGVPLLVSGNFGYELRQKLAFEQTDCPMDLSINLQELNGVYQSEMKINVLNSMAQEGQVIFASNEIEINENFEVRKGTELSVQIDGCPN